MAFGFSATALGRGARAVPCIQAPDYPRDVCMRVVAAQAALNDYRLVLLGFCGLGGLEKNDTTVDLGAVLLFSRAGLHRVLSDMES